MKKNALARKIFFGIILAVIFLGLCFVAIGIVVGTFTKEASAATYDESFIGPLPEKQHVYVGYHDESSCDNAVRGWVKDRYFEDPVKVGVWLDWPKESPLTQKVAEVVANELRIDLPFESKYHGFTWKLPEEYLNDTYTYYVYVLDDSGQPTTLLNRSGRTLYCGDENHFFGPGDHVWIMVHGLRIRTGPGLEYPARYMSSKWMNFRIEEIVYDKKGDPWYRIGGDDERLKRFGSSKLYITADHRYIKKDVPIDVPLLPDTVERWIEMDRSGPVKKVSVYEENAESVVTKRVEFPVSTGLGGRTPTGIFRIFVDEGVDHRRRVDHMRGYDYDLTGIGYVMYYSGELAFHVRWWRLNEEEKWYVPFGGELSHGCVNEPPDAAKWLWYWINSTLPDEEFVWVISR